MEEVIGRKWDETGIVVAGELHKAKLHASFMGGVDEKVVEGDKGFIKYELEVFGDIEDFSDRIKTACKKAGLDIEAVDHGAEE